MIAESGGGSADHKADPGTRPAAMPHARTWGFRLSAVDLAVLTLTGPATWLLWRWIGPLAGIMPLAVGHFFLFCNVFRIHRWKELVWAATCLVNVGTWFALDVLSWWAILLVQTPCTVAMIWTECRHPRYHGILAARINRRLDDYLASRV